MRSSRSSLSLRTVGALAAAAVLAVATGTAPATAVRTEEKVPVAVGTGGAVSTVDPEATAAGLEVLRRGGNAVDAAVAAAATLGVTEPYSAGIGGGGFFVYYDAGTGQVHTIDGRETAPMAMRSDSFVEDGVPIPFAEAMTSGLSAGVPGTPATWERALQEWGTLDLRRALHPAIAVARRGFVVDQTFVDQTAANAARFAAFTSSAELFLPDGAPPEVGSVFRNRDLANTYRLLAKEGTAALYGGTLGEEIVATVQEPPVARGSTRKVRAGLMQLGDLASYVAPLREPTHLTYRGLDVYGMAPPSSGGSTVGEALNILETVDLGALDETQALHHYLEAGALAFADRNRYVGDVPGVPLAELLSDGFAAERACLIDPAVALVKPVPPGKPDGDYAACGDEGGTPGTDGAENLSTTHLTTADQWGNVVAYTLTIESTGGNGIVVPERGFLLNNELTDFNFVSTQGDAPDPNLPAPGKRPRSSMSPTIVLEGGEPLLALGSPGGSTIITTVLQVLVNRLDLGMDLGAAVAAPRATPRNGATVQAEPGFPRPGLEALGHKFADNPEIGAAAAIELLDDGRFLAVAEPARRGGGSAGVVSGG